MNPKEFIVVCSNNLCQNKNKKIHRIRIRRGFYAYPKGKSIYVFTGQIWELFILSTYFTDHYEREERIRFRNWINTLQKNKDRYVFIFGENIGIKNFVNSSGSSVSIIKETLIPLKYYDMIIDK